MNIKMECAKCKKYQEMGLDKKTEKIYCEVCKSEVPGNYFQVQKLKLAKKYRNPEPEVKGAYFVRCKKCDKLARPELKEDKGYCVGCHEDLNLSKHYIIGLREYLHPTNANGKNSKQTS